MCWWGPVGPITPFEWWLEHAKKWGDHSVDANFLGLYRSRPHLSTFQNRGLLSFSTTPNDRALAIKRLIDIVFSFIPIDRLRPDDVPDCTRHSIIRWGTRRFFTNPRWTEWTVFYVL